MADTKITALTALTAADPANDVLPIVDVSDTTMAASGTTKKISINNVLGCSGTATLASATISGNLTVDTSTFAVDAANNRVFVGTAPVSTAYPLFVTRGGTAGSIAQFTDGTAQTLTIDSAAGGLIVGNANNGYVAFTANGLEQYRIAPLGVFTWADGAGGTRMTLNSTGLGVGVASPSRKFEVHGTPNTIGGTATGMLVTVANSGTAYNASPTSGLALWNKFNSSGSLFPSAAIQAGKENATDGNYAGFLSLYTVNSVGTPNEQMRIDSSGNVGIGVASPTSQLTVGSGGTANPAATVAFHKSTSDEYRLKLTSSTFNAAGKWIGLGLGYSSDYMKMAIIAEAKDTNARGNLYFALNNDATSANASIADAKMTLKSTGQVRFVPLAADPSGAEAGDVYYNSTSNKLKCYNGTTWNDLF